MLPEIKIERKSLPTTTDDDLTAVLEAVPEPQQHEPTTAELASSASPDSSASEATPSGPPPEGEGTPAGADADQAGGPISPTDVMPLVAARLEDLESDWTEDQLEEWLNSTFLNDLADVAHLSETALKEALSALIVALTEAGYVPKTCREYIKAWKQIARAKAAKDKEAKQAAQVQPAKIGTLRSRFAVVSRTMPDANDPQFFDSTTGDRLAAAPPEEAFKTKAIFDREKGDWLTNFTLTIDREVEVRDEFEPRHVFQGNLKLFGKDYPFEIRAEDFADNNQLKAALMQAGGSRVVISGKPDTVREAISTLSWRPGIHIPSRAVVTTDFGWAEGNDAFLVPDGRITAGGFVPTDEKAELRVALGGEELARHLALRPLPGVAELRRVKQHLVNDFLQLHGPRVTYSLLGAVGAAVLRRFAPDSAPFGLWLLGLTGAGKSFAAKLAMNFFGDFAVTSGQFGSWGSTTNYLQRQGYFFKDALYLIDDYKPEVIPPYQVVRVLQNYADSMGRGRLKADATTNTSRPIRGLLVSTGEDVPEHNASALARSIVIPVPQQPKDLARGQRCLGECRHYSGVLADFIQQILTEKRGSRFTRRVAKLQRYFYKDIGGKQNDSRIAGNFALLGAGFAEMAYYLRDVWPGWKSAVKQFLSQDLKEVRDAMLGMVKEQEPGEVFWSVLGSLVEHNIVELAGRNSDKSKPVIGKEYHPHPDGVVAGRTDTLYCVSTDLALAEVNKCLRAQGRPELKLTAATLLGHLRRRGRVLDEDGQQVPVTVTNTPSRQLRIAGQARRAFITSRSLLLGLEPDGGQGALHTPSDTARTGVGVSHPRIAVTGV